MEMETESTARKIYKAFPGMNAGIKLLIVFTLVGLYFAWFVAPTPGEAEAYVRAHGWTMPPYSEMPSVLWMALNFWVLYLIADALFYGEKIGSDCLIVEGLDHTESCNAGNIMEKGDFACILGGGIKRFGTIFPGNIASIAPRTHFYKIGSSIIIDAYCDPAGDLRYVPYEWKDAIRARRGGLTGIETCVVGFMNNSERRNHLTFFPNQIDGKWSKTGDVLSTESFITQIKKMNGHIDIMFQVDDNETKGLRERLSVPAEVAKSTVAREQPQGLSKLIYSGES